jgi:predicted nuclease with TOPRIM domain
MERMKVKYVIDGKDYVTLPAYEILEDKYKQLEEENRKLKERINELEKCNLNLQEWLDRKEELNKSYRKEIEKLKAPRNIRNSDEWRKTHPFG